jgi:hypothetical protein
VSRWPSDPAGARQAVDARLRAVRAGVTRAWAGVRGRRSRHVVYLHEHGVVGWAARDAAGPGDAFDSFGNWCAAHRGADAQLRVSGQALHSIVVDLDLGLLDTEAVRGYARQQFTHYHGPQAADWPLAVWAQGTRRGACGLHGVDMAALRADAAAHDVRLRGLTPAWAAGLGALASRHPEFRAPGRHALLLVEGRTATWIAAEDGIVVTLRQKWLDAAHIDAVGRLLASLVDAEPPLASRPIVAGWGLEAGGSLPADAATHLGALEGTGTMAEWLCAEPRP